MDHRREWDTEEVRSEHSHCHIYLNFYLKIFEFADFNRGDDFDNRRGGPHREFFGPNRFGGPMQLRGGPPPFGPRLNAPLFMRGQRPPGPGICRC